MKKTKKTGIHKKSKLLCLTFKMLGYQSTESNYFYNFIPKNTSSYSFKVLSVYKFEPSFITDNLKRAIDKDSVDEGIKFLG